MIQSYFNSERISAVLLVVMGVLAICMAAWIWRNGAFWKGASLAFAAVAIIQISVGTAIFISSTKQSQNMSRLMAAQKTLAVKIEIERIHTVLKGFSFYLTFELGVILIGLVILITTSSDSFWRGFSVALLIQAGLVFASDLLAAKRAQTYLTWLSKL